MKGTSALALVAVLAIGFLERDKISNFIHKQIGTKNKTAYSRSYLGQGGVSTLGPLYFSGAAMTPQRSAPLAPGGAARSTVPGLLSHNGFKGRSLNHYGR